jgi:crotonobetainyl-CoA:carnitine CoA-transferase CaiB-like acyl-CoA transferase
VSADGVVGAAPLAGLRVLDLGRFVSGSYVSMCLGALGAEVVKVEPPEGGDSYRGQGTASVGDESALFLALNNGKRSLALDLRAPEARPVLDALVDVSDVVVQNARPGSLARYGLDEATVRARNPRVVYASVSGFGEVGPEAPRGGFDLVVQAEGGIMGLTGVPGGDPVAVGAPLLDIGSAVSCLAGVLAALVRRERTGEGAAVASSLFEFSLAGLTTLTASYLASGQVPAPAGSHSPMFAPYGVFATADDPLVLAGAGSEALWAALCDVLGRPELVADERFATNAERVRHRHELTPLVEQALASAPAVEWVARLTAAGVPAGRVATLDALVASEQVAALGQLPEVVHATAGPYRTPGTPLRLDGAPVVPRSAAPALGADTADVLAELGCSPEAIDDLVRSGVARCA